MRSSKRALSSTSATACLPRSVASISAGHQRGVVARAVDGLLDRQHVRVRHGLLDEPLHRGRERVVGMVHEQVAFAHRAEHVGRSPSWRSRRGWVMPTSGSSCSSVWPGSLHDLPQGAHVEQAVHRVDLLVLHPSSPFELFAQLLGAAAPTSTRTTSPKRRRRSSSSTACSRSAASSETSRSASRVTRKTS